MMAKRIVVASPVLVLLAVFAIPFSIHSSVVFAFSTNSHRPAPKAPRHVNSNTNPNDGGASFLPPPNVLCVGEVLWDSLPSGIFLGGAPTNVAVHLASLFQKSTDDAAATVAVAACLGNDQLGKEAHRRLSVRGVRVDYIQYHHDWETGMATAILDENGDATYEFNTPAAWDGLRLEDALCDLAEQKQQSSRVFVMGTIAGRLHDDHGATSLTTLSAIRNTAPEGSVVLDVNLRSPWYTPDAVLQLAKGAAATEEPSPKKLALLKINEEELCELEQWCGLEDVPSDDHSLTGSILEQRMERLAMSLNAQRVCVTRGKDGAALFCRSNEDSYENEFHENSGYGSILTANNDSDTVGAGDAFLASLINSLFIEKEMPLRALERACALGGYVASCRGATPEHDDAPEDLKRIFS